MYWNEPLLVHSRYYNYKVKVPTYNLPKYYSDLCVASPVIIGISPLPCSSLPSCYFDMLPSCSPILSSRSDQSPSSYFLLLHSSSPANNSYDLRPRLISSSYPSDSKQTPCLVETTRFYTLEVERKQGGPWISVS